MKAIAYYLAVLIFGGRHLEADALRENELEPEDRNQP